MEFPSNIPGSILDEVALEGLEGITISALWIRLKLRKSFPIALDDESKIFIWKLICEADMIEMFELETPRPPLIPYNRNDHLDPELEIICEPEILPEDIYPVSPVEDKINGIRGSCATYLTRKNISSLARQLTLEEALSKYGECLVLVASQAARNTSLAGTQTDSLDSLMINSYVMLERIGRSRELGEVTQGKHGLSRLNIQPKSAFYFRKKLLADGLLMKQPISMRISNRNVLGSLLHLTRFYSLRLPKLLFLLKRLIQILKDAAPLHMLDYPSIRAKLNTSVQLKKILATNEMRSYAVIETVPFRTMFPEAPVKDWKMRNGDGEKQVKVVRLLDPTVDPETLFLGDEAPPDDGSLGSDEEESTSSGILTNAVLQSHHYSLAQQAYQFVEASGSEGLTQGDLAEQLGLSSLDARATLRVLTRLQVVDCVVKEVKKNRVFLYVSKQHFGSNAIRAQFEQEQQKIKGLIKTSNDATNDSISTSRSNTPKPSNVELEKDVSLTHENVEEEGGLFRPNVYRGILTEGETVSELTHRSLKRVNLILEAIRTHIVIEEIGVLLRLIAAEEAKEGVEARMDRRSLKRLLARLANEGQLKQMRINLRCGERERALNFICQPDVDQNHSVIRSAIDQAKLKLFCISKHKVNRSSFTKPEKIEFNDDSVPIDPSVTDSVMQVKEQFGSSASKGTTFKAVHHSSGGRLYGCEPKCIRLKELHRLFYYLVYGYDGELISDPAQIEDALRQNNPCLDWNEEDLFANLPDIYQTKVGWKMFIDPLPHHAGWPLGWTFLCDILLRLPLSIFVKIVNITYAIDGLDAFLKHPIKQHLLIKHLPLDVRQGLIYARKYIFSVHEVVTSMVYLGLAQFGPHSLKEKDQVFIYLNRKTSILDTTTSAPGYHHISRDIEYERKTFTFESLDDVERYWYEVWSICSNTLLGSVNTVAGQSITLEMLKKKPAMIEASRMREPEEAPKLDNGEVPGDHLGAAGFDSAFFAHLKRNWTYNKTTTMMNRLEQHMKKTGNVTKVSEATQLKPDVPVAPGRLAGLRNNIVRFADCNTKGSNFVIPVTVEENVRHTSKGVKRRREDSSEPSSKKPTVRWSKVARKTRASTKPASRTRVVKARKPRGPRRPYYDEKDRQALLLMRRLRVTWSSSEDSFLLMCKVAATYLNGSLRQMVPFCVVRDCLHEAYPESQNKTSRACQRRVAYMMRNPTTEYQVVNAYQELEQDPEIVGVSGGGPLTKEDRSNGIEKTEELIVDRFRKLLEYLKPRYAQGGSSTAIPGLDLPDTIEEFYQQYELTYSPTNLRHRRPILEVKNVVDVNCSVVYNVIHSSMCTTEDKSAWGFHLFNIYQQYPDNLVRSTLAKMKNDMMIAQRKRSLVRNKKLSEMPLSSVPYKLSITYIHLFLSRYQYPVFHRSYELLRTLMDEKNKVPPESKAEWKGLEVSRIHEGGNAAMVVTMFSLGLARFHCEIPDQIIIFDPKLKEHPEEFDNLIKRYNNWVKDVDNAEKANKDDKVQQQRRRLGLTTAAATGALASIPKLLSFNDTQSALSSQDSAPTTAGPSLITSGLGETVCTPSAERHQSHLIMRTASRIGLHMLREDMNIEGQTSSDQCASQIQQEHFVINSCKIFLDLDLPENASQGWLFVSPKQREEIIQSITTTIPFPNSMPSEPYLELYTKRNYSEGAIADAARIVEGITKKREMGVLATDLPHIFNHSDDPSVTLEQHISLLTESKTIMRVGVVAARYVFIKHIDPWVIKSFRLLRSGREKLEPFNSAVIEAKQNVEESQRPTPVEEEMNISQPEETHAEDASSAPSGLASESTTDAAAGRRRRKVITYPPSKKIRTVDSLGTDDRIDLLVMVKPWVKIDGGLNRRVLDRLLGAVLSHILSKPGSNLSQLNERFHPALQPFQTRELVEILERIGCIELYSIKKTGKAGPFAPRTTLELVPVEKFAPDSTIYCDPKTDAVIRLGEFIGDKKYEKDYIPKCSCHNNLDI